MKVLVLVEYEFKDEDLWIYDEYLIKNLVFSEKATESILFWRIENNGNRVN